MTRIELKQLFVMYCTLKHHILDTISEQIYSIHTQDGMHFIWKTFLKRFKDFTSSENISKCFTIIKFFEKETKLHIFHEFIRKCEPIIFFSISQTNFVSENIVFFSARQFCLKHLVEVLHFCISFYCYLPSKIRYES